MKYKVYVFVVLAHLALVAIRSFNTAIPNKVLLTSTTAKTLLNIYTQYTVMQADYAFFSPNVGYAPSVQVKLTTPVDSFYVPFNIRSGEMGLRMFTSFNAFNNIPEARELMARSWAAHALKKHPQANGVVVSFYLKIPPSYQQYSRGYSSRDSLVFEVKYKVND